MANKVVWPPIRERTDVERELEQDEQPKTRNERIRERWNRAYARAAADNLEVTKTGDSEYGLTWHVCHPNGGRCYFVTTDRAWGGAHTGELTCNCAAGDDPDGICKHRAAVLDHEEARTTAARIRWQGKRARPARPAPTPVRDHIDEARAQMGYLLHYTELTPAAADSVKRALLALNRAYNAS